MALPPPPVHTMMGWIWESHSGVGGLAAGKRRRFGFYDDKTRRFACYLTEESALLEDRPPEIGLKVKYALARPQREPGYFEFAFNSEEEHQEGKGRFHIFAVESEDLQALWVDSLPPPREFTVKGYLHKRRIGAKKLMGNEFDLRYAVYDVISGYFAYYESEQEAFLDQKPRGAARIVSAVLRPTKEHPYMFSFFSEDGKDFHLYVDTQEKLHMWMNALPMLTLDNAGNTDRIMTTLRGEVESLRRRLKLEGAPDDVVKASTLTAEQVINVQGPTLNRDARGSNVDAMRLKRELENLRAENRKLRLEGAGDLAADEEEELLQVYLVSLRSILVMRRQGKFVEEIFETYNENLAQLPDALVTEMYKNFMLIYLEEADDEVLERMQLSYDEVDDNVLGFAEMMTIKLGEMMDQPRHVRIAAIANEKRRKEEQERARVEKMERERQNYAKIQALKEEVERSYLLLMPTVEALAAGEGEEADVRRFSRRNELQLLTKGPAELKALSKFQWQSLSTSGLKRNEIAALIFHLQKPGVPAQAESFLELLKTKYEEVSNPAPAPRLAPARGGAGKAAGRARQLTGIAERAPVASAVPIVDPFAIPDVQTGRMDLARASERDSPSSRFSEASSSDGAPSPPLGRESTRSARSESEQSVVMPPPYLGMRPPPPPIPEAAMPPPIPPPVPPPVPPRRRRRRRRSRRWRRRRPADGPRRRRWAPPPPPMAPPPPPMAPPPIPPPLPAGQQRRRHRRCGLRRTPRRDARASRRSAQARGARGGDRARRDPGRRPARRAREGAQGRQGQGPHARHQQSLDGARLMGEGGARRLETNRMHIACPRAAGVERGPP